MLQSTDTERVGNKEGSWGHAQISLGRGNRRDFMSRLRVGEDGNMNNWVVRGQKRRILKENTGKGGHFVVR